jgi:hypothetical protein
MTSDWGNFENWLSSERGLIIYLIGFVTIATYLTLLVFLRDLRRMHRIPAMLIWLGFGLLPILLLVTLTVSYAVYFCTPPLVVPLVTGLVYILAKPRNKKPIGIGNDETEAE